MFVSKDDGLVKSRKNHFPVIPACPESFFFSALSHGKIPDKRE